MSQDHLEDRLEALLRGRALDLQPRPDAAGVLQGGVRRARRRRRAVQTGVPAVLTVVAIAAGFALLPDQEQDSGPPLEANVLSESGIGELSLGMTVGEARAEGLIGATQDGLTEACREYSGTGPVESVVAREGVIVRIRVDAMADTSEGIHLGSTYGELVNAYAELRDPAGLPPVAQVLLGDSGTTRYEFGLDFTPEESSDEPEPLTPQTRVNSLALSTVAQSCSG